MSLFDADAGTPAQQKARRSLARVNADFTRTHQQHVREVREFWRHDLEKEPTGVTGLQEIQAMGTSAQAFLSIAYARVVMMITIQGILGRDDLVDVAQMMPPYDLTFNQDGSLNTATLKE